MRITIVMGFFLPVPPVAGGATEKSWHGLACEFAAAGHTVTVISRRWPGWPDDEWRDGVRHLRLRGWDHTPHLLRNLWRDLRWSLRAGRALPPADITVVNCLALPVWLGWRRRDSGCVVVMPGRLPKGQYRFYRRIDRVLAVSSTVRDAVLAENPALGTVTTISGYPIAWDLLAAPRPTPPAGAVVTLGYVGRIHREKGLDLLVAALALLARRTDLPPWRLVLGGPADAARGGSGPAYGAALERGLAAALPHDRFELRPPIFDDHALAAQYREIDVFCHPSLATQGETFGVSVVEAMAAGAVPVVSRLACFGDFIRAGENGEVFDHTAGNAAQGLADVIAHLLTDPARRARLARAAQADARAYDRPAFAARLLADFSTLKHPPRRPLTTPPPS
jgi:glycosyltransferase involved in cell wall biosynthesis